ncbi:MAG: Bsp6I family type II restriction endonuclease [Patescibacteria group bacterium]|nr:Bsp6I family type II restriction endonuclease [Patescibacteria group bacterium]
MKIERYEAKVFKENCTIELMSFTKVDSQKWKKLFDMWKKLKLGLRDYKSREPNFPEGLSEIAFCIYSGSKRFISLQGSSPASFDTFNLSTSRAEQIKASSVEYDLTSFGPKSCWDDLYFLDFYNNKKVDGTFNVYKIPSELVYNIKVNKNQTFKQQQAQNRRPRFSIMKGIIKPKEIKPIATDVKIW